MSQFNFKSAICTNRQQSERLLSLGLEKETADMVLLKEMVYDEENHCTRDGENYLIRPIDYLEGEEHRGHIPAWSLGRLVEIIKGCDFKVFESEIWRRETKHFILRLLVTTPDDLFENAIQVIETLVCKGYFNKEYLV